MTDRWPELRISCPREQGYIVWCDGEPIAAITSRAELADWIEQHLSAIPGEQEREARDMEAAQRALANVEPFPKVISPRTEGRKSRLWGKT